MKTAQNKQTPRARVRMDSVIARMANEHSRCAEYYRNATSDPHNINLSLLMMHSDIAAIYSKIANKTRGRI